MFGRICAAVIVVGGAVATPGNLKADWTKTEAYAEGGATPFAAQVATFAAKTDNACVVELALQTDTYIPGQEYDIEVKSADDLGHWVSTSAGSFPNDVSYAASDGSTKSTSTVFKWTAPADASGPVSFRAVCARMSASPGAVAHVSAIVTVEEEEPITAGGCEAGTYITNDAAGCTKCAAGSFSSEEEAKKCTPCVAGTFTTNMGSVKCEMCPEGSFTDDVGGATVCTTETSPPNPCKAGFCGAMCASTDCETSPPNPCKAGFCGAMCASTDCGDNESGAHATAQPCLFAAAAFALWSVAAQ